MLYSANKTLVITKDFILGLVLNAVKPFEKFVHYVVASCVIIINYCNLLTWK